MDPAAVVRTFLESMQARSWEQAGTFLADDIEIRYAATDERFVGDRFLAMNRDYPAGWILTIDEIVASGERVASRICVELDGVRYLCAGFYTVRDGRIQEGIEHWLTAGADEPPAWRAAYTTPG